MCVLRTGAEGMRTRKTILRLQYTSRHHNYKFKYNNISKHNNSSNNNINISSNNINNNINNNSSNNSNNNPRRPSPPRTHQRLRGPRTRARTRTRV
jgi:hypothetical protein